MALVKYNNNSISAVTSAASIPSGALTHIKTLTASSSSTLSFVHGSNGVVLDSTYPIYKFQFSNIHTSYNESFFEMNMSVDGGSNYNVAKTTTYFKAQHGENGGGGQLGYQTGQDLTSATGFQLLGQDQSAADNDASGGGYLEIYNPSSTDLATSFIGQYSHHYTNSAPGLIDNYVAGYCSAAAAIDGVQFKMDSNNISTGIIKMYGVSS